MVQHTVVIVEDDAPTRQRLALAVGEREELSVVAEAGSLGEGLAALQREAPDVVLVDLGLPDGSGLDLIQASRRLSADTHCLVVTVFGDERNVVAAIEAGARGYLLKDASYDLVAQGVLDVLAGGSPISPPIARHLLRRFHPDAEDPRDGGPHLSEREREILELVVKGFTYPEIASLLQISTHTVTTHVRRIYRKLEVSSRAEAVYEALHLGLVKLDA